jgi:hypothetical protein
MEVGARNHATSELARCRVLVKEGERLEQTVTPTNKISAGFVSQAMNWKIEPVNFEIYEL